MDTKKTSSSVKTIKIVKSRLRAKKFTSNTSTKKNNLTVLSTSSFSLSSSCGMGLETWQVGCFFLKIFFSSYFLLITFRLASSRLNSLYDDCVNGSCCVIIIIFGYFCFFLRWEMPKCSYMWINISKTIKEKIREVGKWVTWRCLLRTLHSKRMLWNNKRKKN